MEATAENAFEALSETIAAMGIEISAADLEAYAGTCADQESFVESMNLMLASGNFDRIQTAIAG